jgi:hypothetical protein
MRCFTSLVVASACVSAMAQSGLQVAGRQVELGAPKALAVGVSEVFWHPEGLALVYYAKDADGTYLGVYSQNADKTKAVLRFEEGTNVHFEAWLPKQPVYLIATSRPIPGREMKHWSLTTIDARTLSAKEVWSNDYASGAEVGIEVNASPSLDHAIVTVTDPEGRHPVVLLDGAVSAVYSRDVAAAWAQGSSFAGWSVDGTAYFSALGAPPVDQTVVAADVAVSQLQGTFEIKLSVDTGSGNLSSDIPLLSFWVKASPVAPGAGTPVLELMPRNAVLRPVLSRGPYVGPEVLPHVVYPKPEESVVTSLARKDGSGALWLVRLTGDEGQPYGTDGLLIAAEAGKSWMCTDGNWVAYETAGALFIRRITYGGQPFSKALFPRGGG